MYTFTRLPSRITRLLEICSKIIERFTLIILGGLCILRLSVESFNQAQVDHLLRLIAFRSKNIYNKHVKNMVSLMIFEEKIC